MPFSSVDEFRSSLRKCVETFKIAKKRKVNLNSNSHYAEKARSSLASLRKAFLKLQRDYPKDSFPAVAFRLTTIEPLINKLVEIYPASPRQMMILLNEIKFREESELAVEIETTSCEGIAAELFFLPDDLIEERHSVLKRIIWEVNRTYGNACYNSCAAMVRRLTEMLIIEAYEHHKLHSSIVDGNNDYVGFKELIGKASSQQVFNLTRETKHVLPDLKFFGDLGVHNRMALVRKQDLDRLHNAIRIAIEELYRNIQN